MDEAEVDDDAEDDEDDLEEGYSELINKDYNALVDGEEEGEDSYSHRRRLQHLMETQEEDKIEEYYRYMRLCIQLSVCTAICIYSFLCV